MTSYEEGLTVGDLLEFLQGVDKSLPVVVSASIIAVPLSKKLEIKDIFPDKTTSVFINPAITLGIDKKDF